MSFGLDIGSHSVKVVQLAKEGEKWRLLAAGLAPTPSPGLSSESEKAHIAVAEAIKKLLGDAKITERNVVFALPEVEVYTRLVSFPPLTESEVASAIEWQVESYIPIPKKDAIYDHQIVNKTEKGVEVLLVASPKLIVSKYMKVLDLVGLNPLAAETELIALSRSIAPVNKRCLVVDFGASSTDIAVAVNKQVMFSRSFPTGGEAFTRAVAQGIGVQVSQAEEYKKTYGLTETKLEGKVKQSIESVVSVFIDELKKAIAYWANDHPNEPVETAVLSGGSSGLPALVPILTNKLGIEVTIGDPFATVLKDERVAKSLASYAPLYAIAVGLAMRIEK